MFDTHCHLNFFEYDDHVETVIDQAKKCGVTRFVVPGVDITSSKKAYGLSITYKNVFAAAGIHPTLDLETLDMDREMEMLSALIGENETVVAVGEVGLDYYRYSASPRLQKLFLEAQIKIAIRYDKALIFHCRHAADDLVKVLAKFGRHNSLRAVFHCAEPDAHLLDYAKKHSVFLGVDGDVTYDTAKQTFVKSIPLDLLVLETDSPYLVPRLAKTRGQKINSPKNLVEVCDSVAVSKNITPKALSEITTTNAKKLFGLG